MVELHRAHDRGLSQAAAISIKRMHQLVSDARNIFRLLRAGTTRFIFSSDRGLSQTAAPLNLPEPSDFAPRASLIRRAAGWDNPRSNDCSNNSEMPGSKLPGYSRNLPPGGGVSSLSALPEALRDNVELLPPQTQDTLQRRLVFPAGKRPKTYRLPRPNSAKGSHSS